MSAPVLSFTIETRHAAKHIVWKNGAVRAATEVEVALWEQLETVQKSQAALGAALSTLMRDAEAAFKQVMGGPLPPPAPPKQTAPASTPPTSSPPQTKPPAPAAPATAPASGGAAPAPAPAEDASASKREELKAKLKAKQEEREKNVNATATAAANFGKRPEQDKPKLPG